MITLWEIVSELNHVIMLCGLVFQEDFAQACITFLRRRCPYLLGLSLEKELPKSVQLPQETVVTMLSCLQSFLG